MSASEQGSSRVKMQAANSKMLPSVSWCHIPGNDILKAPFNLVLHLISVQVKSHFL